MSTLKGRSVALALHYQNDQIHPDGRLAMGISARDDVRRNLVAAASVFLASARDASVPLVHVRIAFPRGYPDLPADNPMFASVAQAGAMQDGEWGSMFYDKLAPHAGELVISHDRVSAFYRTPLDEVLRGMGATRLYLGGVATNGVVEHTARDASDRDYAVTCVSDACATGRTELHGPALSNIGLFGTIVRASEIAWE